MAGFVAKPTIIVLVSLMILGLAVTGTRFSPYEVKVHHISLLGKLGADHRRSTNSFATFEGQSKADSLVERLRIAGNHMDTGVF
ncbi:uncharacterized protein BYT42DRAFT_579802, partial [Radiomyces spectabilis]|uniref:uncharacterized protein n=1 Tax=Radiomyces spectabilis TaxID=64574 RepID=UPI0022212A83